MCAIGYFCFVHNIAVCFKEKNISFNFRTIQIPLSRGLCQYFDPYFGGRLNGWCYFRVKKFSHQEKEFQCVSLDSHSSLDLDANGHQSSFSDFDLNSYSHGVKIEVKQVDDNYTWLYNENA